MKLRPILYIEDDENDVFLMRRALRDCGVAHPLVVASDSQEAIATLAALTGSGGKPSVDSLPALILLDLNLPGKSGHDVLRWVRENPVLRNLIVIILTSSSHDLDVHKAYTLGANAYVVKPPIFDALAETVRTLRDFWLKQNFPAPLASSLAAAFKEEQSYDGKRTSWLSGDAAPGSEKRLPPIP